MFKLIKDVLSALNTVVRFILDGSGRKKKKDLSSNFSSPSTLLKDSY